MLDSEPLAIRDRSAALQELQGKVARLAGATCGDCDQPLCEHQVLFSIALGLLDRPLCLPCLARSLERQPDELREHLRQHFRQRECFQTVWDEATQCEAGADRGRPRCIYREDLSTSQPILPREAEPTTTIVANDQAVEWDAGGLACGDLLLQLRQRIRALAPTAVLSLTAQDRGAIEDIPAWCRLTGHRLLVANHPHYRIERKSP